ncbi:coproporphyrinogen III oxidase family protein [Phragmitibacter flavus]|uniref:Coproporphyrinogen III oxidase family protein n=1 Tax=Phragmitibacter flavus TaxID=2576071 RepID=A0A5R8K833_9BACT|nr:coproporphyrinogen-III oxidase family protein [Phragmitibacter flavus]TLD68470.1 coproporphyrinogen III oxidase family protein [Phragmitibacter flavus]
MSSTADIPITHLSDSKKGQEKHHATEVGNYFVANYPPFSFWQKEQAFAVEKLLDTAPPEDVPLGLYFHIPFCRKRCHFCYFRVYTDKNASEIRRYIHAGMEEFARYAARPYLKGRKPHFVYFGGGTPSYLSVPQLRELTDRMKDLMPWDEVSEVAFEAEPGTLNPNKLEAIRDIGVTRLSLGVEHFDDHVLGSNGRAHRSGEIDRAYGIARSLGFEHVNIDLIAGMMNDTDELWKATVAKAVEMSPDCVTIYQMEVPYNTGIYKQMKADGKETAPVADWETKRGWVNYAFTEFEKAGYTVTSAYTVVKDPERIKFVYRDALWEGADLLPIGVASFGHLGGIHLQNQAEIAPYIDTIERGDSAIFRAYATSPDERFIREFILKLKLGSVRPSYYQAKFGEDVLTRFAPQLQWIESEGFGKVDAANDKIELTRDGLLQVDRLLHEFFLPHHRTARYT